MSLRFASCFLAVASLMVGATTVDAKSRRGGGFLSGAASAGARAIVRANRSEEKPVSQHAGSTGGTGAATPVVVPVVVPETVTDIRSSGSARNVPLLRYGSRAVARSTQTDDVPGAARTGCIAGCF